MNKRRLTFKRYFEKYKSDTPIAAIQIGGDCETAVITETEEDWYEYDTGRIVVRPKKQPTNYLVGEIADRLYEYEQLGYSPEELKEIIELYKGRKKRLNALYGATVYGDMDVPSLYPRLFVARGNGKSYAQAKAMLEYVECDHFMTKKLEEWRKRNINPLRKPNLPEIQNVIFNDPATIVLWADGTKTVVKADKEDFDPEKGLAMAISKKALGNKGNYFDIFKKWTAKYTAYSKPLVFNVEAATKGTVDGLNRAAEKIRSLSQTLTEHRRREDMRTAFELLNTARKSPRITKAELIESIETAMTYLRDFREKEN